MMSACGRQWLLGLILTVGSSIKPSSAWVIGPTAARSHVTHRQQRATATGRSSGSSITTMRATPSPGGDDDTAGIPASMSRGEWLRVGASLAAMAPVFALGKEDASAATSSDVTVLGAGGKTGRECVEYLASKGTGVRAVARSLTNKEGEPLAFTTTKGITMETADVTVPSSLPGVIKGASAVIFASSASKQGGSAKAVDYEGVVNVAKACLEAKVPRLVVVSSGGVATPESSIYKFLNLFGEIMSWKIQGEDQLRSMYAAQDVCHYTIVRPGGLTLDPPRGVGAIELNQGDTKSGRIARADVARVCVESIYSRNAEDCTLECYYKDTAKPLAAVGVSNILKQKTDDTAKSFGTESTGDTWDALFSGLKHDA
ncbi:conserved unknown protein [Ectocarpus siliculosus]|uniref:NAD(P)-binding domain-containing protein n=1 Tax=Ectocarpus siliculosus TaxID=2880 RepID=D8LDG8_ECTSI|nr:conserved unknown protein [Ectocarpus siliculosus]|eukprot:CBN74033.1 conserved unknown protein [Ectocarpus siliculosus]